MALRTKSNFALYIINWLVSITEVKSIYCAARTKSLYNTDMFRPSRVKVKKLIYIYQVYQ